MKKTKKETTLNQKKPNPRADKADGESAVLAAIEAMPGPDRAVGERLHAIIKASAPALSPKLWYGMPAYAKDGKVICFFRSGQKFKERYMTLGFNNEANLLRAEGVEFRRRGKDRRAHEESGELMAGPAIGQVHKQKALRLAAERADRSACIFDNATTLSIA
jgi:hypothetical protein